MAIKNPWPNIKDMESNDNTTLSSAMINSGFEFIKDQEVTIEKTGATVEFKNCNTEPFIKVLCDINPTQSGTGDPSPTNPRPINGYSTINVTNDQTVYPVSLGQTVYGGEVDVVGGEVQKTYESVDLGSLSWSYSSSGNAFFYANLTGIKKATSWADVVNFYCPIYKKVSGNDISNGVDFGIASNPSNEQIRISNSNYTDNDQFKTAMSGVYLVYPLATPTTAQITPVTINSVEGNNNLYHDANGNITVKYKTTIRCLMNQ